MVNKSIIEVRQKLEKLIENGASYQEIYNMSVKLDKLIVRFYSTYPQKRVS